MNKGKWNFFIDVVMFLLMAIVVGLGLLIHYILIPGSVRWIKYGRNVELSFLGLDRHEWGYIHFILALVLIGLLVFHIILHWSLIKALYKKFISGKGNRVFIAITFTLLSVLLVVLPFFVTIDICELETGIEKFYSKSQVNDTIIEKQNKRDIRDFENSKEEVQEVIVSEEHQLHHHDIDLSIEVKGYMTLKEVSKKYNISCDSVKGELNIPVSTPNTSKLGYLKKQYNFKMSDIELIIARYKSNQ